MQSERPAWDNRHHLAAVQQRHLPKRPKLRTMNGAPVRSVLQLERHGRRIVQSKHDASCSGDRLHSGDSSARTRKSLPPQPQAAVDAKHSTHTADGHADPADALPLQCLLPPPSQTPAPALTIDHVEDSAEHSNPALVLDMNEQCTCVRELARLGTVGRGSTAHVYRALHIPSLRIVAEKALPATDSHMCRAIAKEVLVTSQLLQASADGADGKCPYLVDIVNVKSDPARGLVCICMEYMDGGSLQDIVTSGGCQDEQVLAGVAKQVLLGLEYMHRRRVIHRDIKPGNLLINRWGVVKISDFGLARQLDTQIEADTFVGTYSYMSPERIIGESYSYASDIWSFGLSLLALSLGRHPYEGASAGGYWGFVQAIRGGELEVPVHCSYELKDFFSLCLQQDPFTRPSAAMLLSHEFLTAHDLSVNAEQLDLRLMLGRCDSRPTAAHLDDSVRWFAERQQKQARSIEVGGSPRWKHDPLGAEVEVALILEAIKAYYISVWESPRCSATGHGQELIPRWNKTTIHELARQIGIEQIRLQSLFRPLVEELRQAAAAAVLEQQPLSSPETVHRVHRTLRHDTDKTEQQEEEEQGEEKQEEENVEEENRDDYESDFDSD